MVTVTASKLRTNTYKLYGEPGVYIGPCYMGDVERTKTGWAPTYGEVLRRLGPDARFTTPAKAAQALAEVVNMFS